MELTDYIPEGLILSDTNWTDNGDGTATTTLARLGLAPLAMQSSTTVDIAFVIDPNYQ